MPGQGPQRLSQWPHRGERGRGGEAALRARGEGGLVVPIFLRVTPKRKNVQLLHRQ